MSIDCFTLQDGVPFTLNLKKWDGFRFICCDCGLVHTVMPKINTKSENLTFRFYRDEEHTKQIRQEDEKA